MTATARASDAEATARTRSAPIRHADDVVTLECEELLERFREDDSVSSSVQYGDDDAIFGDESVRERVEVCLREEVITETIKGKKGLPDTGGPPLVGLAVLGLASLLVGASVIRGGLR